MEDNKTNINDDIVLVGRADAGWNNDHHRANLSEMINESDLSKFVVVLDHQHIEENENSKIHPDLQISGHTHGGQVFPYAIIDEFSGSKWYAEYDLGNTKLLVSSGLGGWGWSFRNEAKCEYVLININ